MRSEYRALVGYKIDIVTVIIKVVKSDPCPLVLHQLPDMLFGVFGFRFFSAAAITSLGSFWFVITASSRSILIRGGCHGSRWAKDKGRIGGRAPRLLEARQRGAGLAAVQLLLAQRVPWPYLHWRARDGEVRDALIARENRYLPRGPACCR